MSTGLDNLKHIVVLMMNGRSFDHMLGGLRGADPRIDGLTGNESNSDPNGNLVRVQPYAEFQGQFLVTPDNHFPGVDIQIFDTQPLIPGRIANMAGFVKSYYTVSKNLESSKKVMYYFPPEKLPVLTTLALEFATFNAWFSSVPGPAPPNRKFAHYGTSFGQVGFNILNPHSDIPSIYERLIDHGLTTKFYYYDQGNASADAADLLTQGGLSKQRKQIFATNSQFLADCFHGTLPNYSFVEPNYNDHTVHGGGVVLASDQYLDHNVQEGERFIASVYNAIRNNAGLWASTVLLIVYSQHGGLYDHVIPPPCTPDNYVAQPKETGTSMPFAFDRLGVRVPAILISPYILKGSVVDGRTFEHASIPNTVTECFLGRNVKCTNRERLSSTFLDLLSDSLRDDDDIPWFEVRS